MQQSKVNDISTLKYFFVGPSCQLVMTGELQTCVARKQNQSTEVLKAEPMYSAIFSITGYVLFS